MIRNLNEVANESREYLKGNDSSGGNIQGPAPLHLLTLSRPWEELDEIGNLHRGLDYVVLVEVIRSV